MSRRGWATAAVAVFVGGLICLAGQAWTAAVVYGVACALFALFAAADESGS